MEHRLIHFEGEQSNIIGPELELDDVNAQAKAKAEQKAKGAEQAATKAEAQVQDFRKRLAEDLGRLTSANENQRKEIAARVIAAGRMAVDPLLEVLRTERRAEHTELYRKLLYDLLAHDNVPPWQVVREMVLRGTLTSNDVMELERIHRMPGPLRNLGASTVLFTLGRVITGREWSWPGAPRIAVAPQEVGAARNVAVAALRPLMWREDVLRVVDHQFGLSDDPLPQAVQDALCGLLAENLHGAAWLSYAVDGHLSSGEDYYYQASAMAAIARFIRRGNIDWHDVSDYGMGDVEDDTVRLLSNLRTVARTARAPVRLQAADALRRVLAGPDARNSRDTVTFATGPWRADPRITMRMAELRSIATNP